MPDFPIKIRACGNLGLNLPVLGLGCWAFGGGSYWGPQSQRDVDAVVHHALDAGLNYFDTAEAYNSGDSETSLGLALKGEGRRTRAIIGTKVSPDNTAPATLRAHCEASLQRMQIDHIDLYMVHWPIKDTGATVQAFDTLADLRREGKIRHIGVSNFGVQQLDAALATGATIAVNQLPYSLLSRGIERHILPLCRDQHIGVIGYMSLMQGLLSDKFQSLDEIPTVRTRSRHFAGTRPGSRHGEAGLEAETWATVQAIRKLARASGAPTSDLAVAWSAANPSITCTLVGCRNSVQLDANLRALDLRLTTDLMAGLDQATCDLRDKLGDGIDLFQGQGAGRTF